MKNDRVVVRLPRAEKELWSEVAESHGMTLSQLVIRSVRGSIAGLQVQKPVEVRGSRL